MPLGANSQRPFEFERDTFAFPNELLWEYLPAAEGRMAFRRREPPPAYAHRCFVLARAARQFHYHANFDPERVRTTPGEYRRLVQGVLRRDPRGPSAPGVRITFPGYASLREFSEAEEALLKGACGGAWRSYVLRSHWRMVFPISRRHQETTAARLGGAVSGGEAPVLHLVRFPQLTINHGMVVFAVTRVGRDLEFQAYDPNVPARPAILRYESATRRFLFPANAYWAGGQVNVIEIFRSWLF